MTVFVSVHRVKIDSLVGLMMGLRARARGIKGAM
jgi:hypothetical protein